MGCNTSAQKGVKSMMVKPLDGNSNMNTSTGQQSISDKNRRRLSISHVGATKVTEEEEEPNDTPERGFITQMSLDEAQRMNTDKLCMTSQPSDITPKGVTPRARRFSMLMGKPAEDIQKGFENKILQFEGPAELTQAILNTEGVGYSCKKGLKPESPNQDDFFICRVDEWAIYGIFDGHGPSGHVISDFVHRKLPRLIVKHPQFKTNVLAALKGAFLNVNHLLEEEAAYGEQEFDCSLSGTTATVVIHKEDKLYVAHVGDSRAVLGRKTKGGRKFAHKNLTNDHKPTNEAEKKRIHECGGEVLRLEGDIPHRVFIKGKMYPGLAMSRAIGDHVGATVGVIAEPDVAEYTITPDDQFIIVATDGVWEFISSQEAVDIIAKQKKEGVQDGSELLAYEAWQRWVVEEENVVDDITVTVAWLHHNKEKDGGPTPKSKPHT
eukprot:Platyproteum_vivax@DN3857_c0_g1_i1.p1